MTGTQPVRTSGSRCAQANDEPARPPRRLRGLVLEGGGGKGAWQFGVLDAFAECDVKFDAVSGTSVGALNGAIWCTGQMQKGRELWTSMALKNVFKVRWLLIAPAFLAALAGLFHATFFGYVPNTSKSSRLLHFAVLSLAALPPLSALIWNYQSFIKLGRDGVAFPALVILAISAIGFIWMCIEPVSTGPAAAVRRASIINTVFFGWCFVLASEIWECFAGKQCSLSGSSVLWIGGLPIYLLALAWLMRRVNVSLFKASPLSLAIGNILSVPLSVPLFATAAKAVGEYYDPDNLDYSAITINGARGEEISRYYQPVPQSALLPIYARVDQSERIRARDQLLASAALPLGVVQAVVRDGSRLVDGGTIDNVPWFPLINELPCDEIVIIHCSPASPWCDETARATWAEADRLRRVIQHSVRPKNSEYDLTNHNNPPTAVPLVEPNQWPRRVIVVAPKEALGNFITGTMNFSETAARKRYALGREAGFQAIQAIVEQTE